MVYLSKIYTKTGDAGETMLGDGSMVAKTSPRVIAMGAVDELNSCLGLVRNETLLDQTDQWLETIQNDLFDFGADLCTPETTTRNEDAPEPLRIVESQVAQLETWIDVVNESLSPLTSFILPGGTSASAKLHNARSVCRRAEIAVWQLAEHEELNASLKTYINRLSDLLFVLARQHNDNGQQDVLWKPGASRG